ncbi:hypothetical protein GCM10012275_50220 [Longimycelium tulufanense]|uniref:DUF4352 domain-containing protein n=1 Tax=Longimycelium tulufanense TaxID=907463 RepID=A0A8J3FWQ0_9PSEU|nr:DUF4190 domain-containing protein [Longimycelium tulufanense]GGM73503.1 hypothetical protein GCM10012275_50220 [Longimycelium tulufanense]
MPPQAPPRNGLGIASLILGLIGLVLALTPLTGWLAIIAGVTGLILGLAGRARVRRGHATNSKVALSGVILSALAIVVGILGMVLFFKAVDELGKGPSSTVGGETKPGKVDDGGIATAAAGTPINVSAGLGNELTVNVSQINPNANVGSQFENPQRGAYLTAHVDATVTKTSGSHHVSSADFRLVHGDGTVSETTFVSGLEGKRLDGANLAVGQKTDGWIVFDVDPAKLEGAKIQMNGIGGKPAAFWTIN